MDCIAHRGFAATAPENTVSALREAAAEAGMVEFDVRRCGSGELVVCHDETVDRVTDGSGPVADHTRAELAALDVLDSGEGVPTLEEVLGAVPADTGLNVELKERGLAADLVEALADHDHEVLVSSFDDEALRELEEVADLPVAAVFSDSPAAGLETAVELDAAAVHPHWEVCNWAFVEQAHDYGLAVNAWTIADDAAARAASAAGVDGLVVDDPGFCR